MLELGSCGKPRCSAGSDEAVLAEDAVGIRFADIAELGVSVRRMEREGMWCGGREDDEVDRHCREVGAGWFLFLIPTSDGNSRLGCLVQSVDHDTDPRDHDGPIRVITIDRNTRLPKRHERRVI